MNNNTTDVKNYDNQFQAYILNNIMNSPDIYLRCKNILKPEYFDRAYQSGINFVHEYASQYDVLPSLENIKVKTQCEFHKTDTSVLHVDSVLKDVEDFCRHKALENAIIEGAKLVQQKKYGQIELLVKEAMLVSLQNDLGLNIYENPEDTINKLKDNQNNFKSGWETLDYRLFGGFGNQELAIFAAASGGGKSVVLQNLAVNFSKRGLKGAYITLELAEELVAVRIYGMMIGRPQSIVKSDVDESSAKIKIEEVTNGTLRVKRMPESITTVTDIEVYIRELQIKTEEKLDYICVDYLDLLTSDSVDDKSNTFMKDKFVSEELRALGAKLDLSVFTASQFNRDGLDADEKSQSQISGGISKIFTADNVIFVMANRERGEMVFDFQKTRNSNGLQRLTMAYSADSLRVSDHEATIAMLEATTSFKFSGNRNIPKIAQQPNSLQGLKNALSGEKPTPVQEEQNDSVINTTNTVQNPVSSSTLSHGSSIRDFLSKRK